MSFDKKAQSAIDAFAADFNAIAVEAADAIAVEAHLSITRGSAGGRKTKKHRHVPSKPGEPPSSDTGVLAGSIETLNVAPFHTQVVAGASYAAHQEFGTSKMAARPFLRPARDKMRDEIQRNAAKQISAALRHHFGRK